MEHWNGNILPPIGYKALYEYYAMDFEAKGEAYIVTLLAFIVRMG